MHVKMIKVVIKDLILEQKTSLKPKLFQLLCPCFKVDTKTL